MRMVYSRIGYSNKKNYIFRIDRGRKRQPQRYTLTVRVCKGSEMLPYLQANNLTCHNFMNAFLSQRQKTLLLTTKAVARG